MNYELCKKLKDAVFPQNTNTKWYHATHGVLLGIPSPETLIDPEVVAVPTLSELIEACGNILKTNLKTTDDFHKIHSNTTLFFHLRKLYQGTDPDNWVATFEHADVPYSSWKRGTGDTPEVAVANLWLKLHETSS